MAFIDDYFMLENEPAIRLYEAIKDEPIFDFHCHLDPKAIYEDKPYETIVDLWLAGDHYKWRLMRAYGISERFITGDAEPFEKFKAWISAVSKAFGNAVYHWSHLELKNIFGLEVVIKEENAEQLYHQLNAIIQKEQLSPRKLLQQAKVTFVGTTDHPLDKLEWHQKIKADQSFDCVVAPTFRPDEAFIDHANFNQFVNRLEEATQTELQSFELFVKALEERVEYFVEHGCRASDISFGAIVYEPYTLGELSVIYQQVRDNQVIDDVDIRKWQTGLFVELCRIYKKYNLVTQVHFGAIRNANTHLYTQLGADVGVDSMGDQTELPQQLNKFIDHLNMMQGMPKMIWYNLNSVYNDVLANTLANFQANEQGVRSQLQFGSGWWFNDTKQGMINQMTAYANQGMLANFVGMLTDSRSFLSFPRHDYFRRILCSFVGRWIVDGEIPEDYEMVGEFVKRIAHDNAEEFFS